MYNFLRDVVAELRQAGDHSDDIQFWNRVRQHAADLDCDFSNGFAKALQSETEQTARDLRTPPGQLAEDVLGPCWELSELRLLDHSQDAPDYPLLQRFHAAVDEVLSQFDGLADALAQLPEALGKSQAGCIPVRMTVQHTKEQPDRIELTIDVDPTSVDNEVAIIVLLQPPNGMPVPLFPNRWDHQMTWMRPGVPMRIPDAGSGYFLRLNHHGEPLIVHAIATQKLISLPVDYIRGLTRWTARSGASESVSASQEFRRARADSIRQLFAVIGNQPGVMGTCSVTISGKPS